MSVFNEILSALNDDIKAAFDCIDKFAEEYQNEHGKQDQNQEKALVNINEDEDENAAKDSNCPEQEKRPKRNASVKARINITKQMNINLKQKLRRDDTDKTRRRKDEDKENTLPLLQVKQEKISLPPEPMETESSLDIPIVPVKQEPNKDDTAMPPPTAAVPKPRKLLPKKKSTDSEEQPTGKRSTCMRKNTETMPPPPAPVPVERAVRSSRRGKASGQAAAVAGAGQAEAEPQQPPPQPRPSRTRAKKKISESSTTNTENTQPPIENGIGSPADKPRPKRTRRGKKAAEEPAPTLKEPTPEPEIIVLKEERISISDSHSPAIPQKTVKKTKTGSTISVTSDDSTQCKKGSKKKETNFEETHVVSMNTTVTISMDKTVVLPNGVYDHTDGKTLAINETVVLDKTNRDTMVLDKPQAKIMDCTVVFEKEAATLNLTDDNSVEFCSPTKDGKPQEPTSAVEAKVQQFEEMAARTTSTKTRAMAKKDVDPENCTPLDKIISKQVLSADTLAMTNNMIFNGKTTQMSCSASKPTAKLPPVKAAPASASKASAISRPREEQLSKDEARRKKEAMLEAKKELQKRKREEKMAAAGAARDAAEKERGAALQAQARDRMEKQAHADQGKLERMKEAERKKQELARKIAEAEERRRAEEQARLARLAEEQRKTDAVRKKQQERSEATKKEAFFSHHRAKESEKRHKKYLEKQKMKQRMKAVKVHTPLKNGKLPPMEPVYMQDGFEHLNSDEDDGKAPPKIPTPDWCKVQTRHRQLGLQDLLDDRVVSALFSVRAQTVDLRAIFPTVERAALRRTSSAVWSTPPALQLSRVQESPF